MMGLTAKQSELLDLLRARVGDGMGMMPTLDELREALGLKAKSGVIRLLDALEERGAIRRLRNRARAIELLDRPGGAVTLPADVLRAAEGAARRRAVSIETFVADAVRAASAAEGGR